jgi:hypothetical protein
VQQKQVSAQRPPFTVERQQRVTRPAENGGSERLTAGGDLFRGRVGAPGGAGAILPQDLADFFRGGVKISRRRGPGSAAQRREADERGEDSSWAPDSSDGHRGEFYAI